MKRILFYYPSNKRSIQIETTIFKLIELGHQVTLLTTCEKGSLHKSLEKSGVKCYSNLEKSNFAPIYYLRNIRFLIQFCRKYDIEYLFSHLQPVNIIAVFAQFFMSTKVIIFRHHFQFHKGHFGIKLEVNKNEIIFDKIINSLAKKIVVPSFGVYNGIIKYESIKKEKLDVIPYFYDFSYYDKPNLETVKTIKNTFKAQLNVIMIARLTPFKRHLLIFPVIKKLIQEGYDLQLLVLDEGPDKSTLEKYISSNNLSNRVHLLGYKQNVVDYMMASDLIIHPSISEASNNVIKEIGLMKKAVAVCQGVGDFDAYIVSNKNGFLMDIEKPEVDAENIIKNVYNNPHLIEQLGSELRKTILDKFGDQSNNIEAYTALLK